MAQQTLKSKFPKNIDIYKNNEQEKRLRVQPRSLVLFEDLELHLYSKEQVKKLLSYDMAKFTT